MPIKIEVKGPIISSNQQWIYDWYGIEATSPKKINDVLKKADGEEVEIEINSGGGSVFAGAEIYTSLRSYKGKTSGTIVGLAASAASVIAMGVESLAMSPVGHIMIHNSSSYSEGDYRDFEHEAEVLKSINKTIATSYEHKTGKNLKELLNMMNAETWMDAEKAKELGFIDKIMFESELSFVASIDNSGLLPQQAINKAISLLGTDGLGIVGKVEGELPKVLTDSEKFESKESEDIKNQKQILKAKLGLEMESSYFYA